jgi:predicted nucleotidyltransferase
VSGSNAPPLIEYIRRRILARRRDLVRLGVDHLAIFGSCVRGTQQVGSDIDIMVDLREGFGYFDFGEIADILTTDLGAQVPLHVSIPIHHRRCCELPA